jgi:hypothetical protein
MKIKTKKEMNLPQFIAWAVDNHITGSFYANDRVNAKMIRFEFGRIVSSHGELRSHDTFTVEVEEPITEGTVFDKLISRYVFPSSMPSYAHAINASIKEVVEDRKKATHIYFENEDNELQLIWKNGKLVD